MRIIRDIEVLETVEEVIDPRHTAVLVIDVQNDEVSESGSMAKHGHDIEYMRRIIPPLRALLDAARERGVFVIYTRSTKSADGRFETGASLRFVTRKRDVGVWDFKLEGTWGNEVPDELDPRPNERQLIKYHSSAFEGTPLDQLLRHSGIRSCIVAGTATEGCVEASVRSLQDHGYYPVIAGDCVTSKHQALHDAALTVMAGRWDVLTAAELIAAWDRGAASRADRATPSS